MNIRDRQYNWLIKKLMTYEQHGIGFNGEGSCDAGNNIFSVTTFFIPLKSSPSLVELSNINYTNCQNLQVIAKSKYGFITRAIVINDGQAYCTFDWKIIF